MNIPENATGPWWDDVLEAYVDGTLSEEETARIDELRMTDATVAIQIDLAEALRDGLQGFSEISCPDSVMESVMAEVRSDMLSNAASNVKEAFFGFLSRQLRPIVATLALILMVVVASRIDGPQSIEDPAVAEALGDVKWTLAYLSEISRQTGSTVRSQALEPLVLNSMRHAVDSFIDN